MFIDTHCHLSSDDYDDVFSIISENRKNGIGAIINCSCAKDTIDEALELCSKYNDIFLAIGFHPSEASSISDDDLKLLEEIVSKNKKVVAIGEIGLDYHYGKDDIFLQKQLFEKQLVLAEKLNLPVVIHTRDAMGDTIEILKRHNNRGVIHCFNGSLEVANILTNLTPEPFRGKVNSSKYIPVIAGKVAEIFNTDVGNVEDVTTLTTCNLFDLF